MLLPVVRQAEACFRLSSEGVRICSAYATPRGERRQKLVFGYVSRGVLHIVDMLPIHHSHNGSTVAKIYRFDNLFTSH